MTDPIDPMTKQDRYPAVRARFVEQARTEGVESIVPCGLLTGLTKTVVETALEAEIRTLGDDKYDVTSRIR